MTSKQRLAKLGKILLNTQLAAARVVQQVISGEHPDAHVPWKEASAQTRAAMLLAQASMAAERAKTISDAPRSFGVVVVSGRLEDTKDGRGEWELRAAKLKEQRSIEAIATPVKEPDGTT